MKDCEWEFRSRYAIQLYDVAGPSKLFFNVYLYFTLLYYTLNLLSSTRSNVRAIASVGIPIFDGSITSSFPIFR